jgi:hypothetical protein
MERLIVCPCGHNIEQHDGDGCKVAACLCRLGRSAVLEGLVDSERDDIRRQWSPDPRQHG